MRVLANDAQRWWALGAVTLAVLAVGLDATVLSLALPTLSTALHASEAQLQWFSSGYLLVVTGAMLPAGLVGDRSGRRIVLAGALALFGGGSAACAAARSAGAFLAARLVLGLAGAGVIVMAVSALTVLFAPAERPKAVGIWAAANFVSIPIGPLLGGWILTHHWWGWVFLINLPVAALALVAVLLLVPESRAPVRPAVDGLGIATSTAGLAGMTYGLVQAGVAGWGSPRALVPIVAGLAVIGWFLAWERRCSRRPSGQPLVDPALFRSRAFTWGVILMSIAVLAMFGALFILPQYFQGVVGADAMGAGVRLLPLVAGLIAGALPADRVAAAAGPKATVALGSAVLAAGVVIGARTGPASTGGFVAAWMAIVGAGVGLAMATAASAALTELPEERAGVGSAVLQALKNLGGPFGSAILGSVLNATYRSRVPVAGLPAAAAAAVRESLFSAEVVARQIGSAALLRGARIAFVAGLDRVLWVSAAFAVAGALLAAGFLPGGPRTGGGGPAR